MPKTRKHTKRKQSIRRKRGGSQEDLNWLKTVFKPRILEMFAKAHKKNTVVLLFKHLFMVAELDFNKDGSIEEMAFFIKKDPYERPAKQNACYLGVSTRIEPKGWSEYNLPTVEAKQIYPFSHNSDLGFGLDCTHYAGSNLTYILFCCWFYTLKLHAQYIGRHDYIITDYDIANVSKSAYNNTSPTFYKDIILQRMSNKTIDDLDDIMKDPKYNLYYERFGFIYPEKREYFENYLRTGKGFVQEVDDHPMAIHRFYLDLSTMTMEDIEKRIELLQLKIPKN